MRKTAVPLYSSNEREKLTLQLSKFKDLKWLKSNSIDFTKSYNHCEYWKSCVNEMKKENFDSIIVNHDWTVPIASLYRETYKNNNIGPNMFSTFVCNYKPYTRKYIDTINPKKYTVIDIRDFYKKNNQSQSQLLQNAKQILETVNGYAIVKPTAGTSW